MLLSNIQQDSLNVSGTSSCCELGSKKWRLCHFLGDVPTSNVEMEHINNSRNGDSPLKSLNFDDVDNEGNSGLIFIERFRFFSSFHKVNVFAQIFRGQSHIFALQFFQWMLFITMKFILNSCARMVIIWILVDYFQHINTIVWTSRRTFS